MSLIQEIDYGTPAPKSEKTVTLTIDGQSVTVPEGTSIMRAAMEAGTQIPKLCATDMLDAFGSCRLCLVEIEGRAGTPASCTTPVAAGMVVHTQTERLKKLRKGVMELYISDHPLDCLTCAPTAIANCRTWPARSACATCATAMTAPTIFPARQCGLDAEGRIQPLFHLRSLEMHRLLALRARLRGSAGHLRADHSGPRLRFSRVSPGMEREFFGSECVSCGACVQACPTATLTEKSVIEIGQPEHSVVTTCAYCGVGCSFKAEMRGEEVVRMVPYKDGKANRGHSCVKGRFAWGYANHKERILKPMIREKITDPVARSVLGRGDRPRRFRVQAHPGQIRPRLDRRHHLVALHQRRNLSGAEADPRRLRQQQCRYLRPRLPLADRLRPEARPSAPRPARRISTRSSTPT
jgi:formate dehydrogenase major subunit